jgi:hypothetical protein
MATSVDERLLDLEKTYWESIQKSDPKAASRLADDPCLVIGPSGIMEIDRTTMEDMISRAPYSLKAFRFDDTNIHVRAISDDVVLVAYPVQEQLHVDGSDRTLDAYHASVWVRRGDRWVCPMHTETLRGDPLAA